MIFALVFTSYELAAHEAFEDQIVKCLSDLSDSRIGYIFAGLVASRTIVSCHLQEVGAYEFDSDSTRGGMMRLIRKTSPHLVGLAKQLLAPESTEMPILKHTLLKMILQVFESTITMGIDDYFHGEVLKDWMNVLRQCMDVPISSLHKGKKKEWDDVAEMDNSYEWKHKRNAFRIAAK